jgi:catechol 2,3-dioxygenase
VKDATMSSAYTPNLSHVGVSCFDVDLMVDFYTSVFGLHLTDEGFGRTFPFKLAFLSSQPNQHHQLALAQNRPQGAVSTVMQLSFKVDDLSQLRQAKAKALAKGATHMRGISHGNALSIYFVDPEENTVEVYLDTPWYVAQPHGDMLDLDKSDQEIWSEVEAVVRADPTFKTVEDWSSQFKAKLHQ